MKKIVRLCYLTTFCILTTGSILWAQLDDAEKSDKEVVKPILLDKSVLSGVGLQPIKLKDTPERKFFQKRLYGGKEISVYVVSSESWTVPFEKFWFDEFIYIFNGKARVGANGKDYHFDTGEYFFAPKGFPGEWEVKAGEHLHYELSVISNKRADSTAVSRYSSPMALDKSVLSGTAIKLNEQGLYEAILADGIELTIKLKAEAPRSLKLEKAPKEQLICVLSGQLILKDNSGAESRYFSGDYFVIPPNFTGAWKSEGHSLVKYICVYKT